MRKLPTRPPRFLAVDNRAVDDQRLSVLDIGLLTMALRRAPARPSPRNRAGCVGT
ncbi:hypothetical protein ACFV3E_45980 [Streptomyces sp. NPDC059718]